VNPVAVDFDLYVYFKCKNGSTPTVTCGMGSTKVLGFDGSSVGCASTNRGSTTETVELTPSCSVVSDITMYVNVARYGGRTCSPYTLSWGDNYHDCRRFPRTASNLPDSRWGEVS